MRDEKLHILQHSLGLNQYGLSREGMRVGHRNYYIIAPTHDGWALCVELIAEGLMADSGSRSWLVDRSHVLSVTEAGRQFVREHSPDPPKLTRSQQRYRRFLSADCGLTFREWLQVSP